MGTVHKRLTRDFYSRDVLEVTPDLLGKWLVRRFDDGTVRRYIISEAEAYRGGEDKACHASRGYTERTSVMFGEGGHVYVYLIYGMYWMFNIVTGPKGLPQASLVRAVLNIDGPGKLTRELCIDRSFYGENLVTSKRLWLEDNPVKPSIRSAPRIGVDYAGEYWKNIHWRYIIESNDHQ